MFSAAHRIKFLISLVSILVSSGCGYSFVRADSGGPVASLCIGQVSDLGTEGDLGLRAVRLLRRKLRTKLAPSNRCAETPLLTGTIRLGPSGVIAFDDSRKAGAHHGAIELELKLTNPQGDVIWRSGFVPGRTIWLRGETLLDTREAQRSSRQGTLDEIVNDLVNQFMSLTPLENAP